MATNPDCIPNPTACTRVGNTTMTLQRPLPRRLLGVWAHPDDEAYLSAGLMARVVAAGGQVTVITATRGEKGTDDPDRYDSESFGAHRELELRNSLAVLGVNDIRFLDLRDGECDLADAATQIGRIAAVIDEVRPDAIVTFGPDGMTNHADHLAISRWATDAWIANPVGELLYATVTHRFAVANRELHDRIGIFGDFPDGQARSVGDDRIALGCTLSESELDTKRLALSAHHSQTAGLAKLMGEDVYRTWFQEETFRCPTRFELAPAIASVPRFEAHRIDASAAAGSTIPALELAA
ncbi:MAG: PIG-L family deacetylase [Actinomycetota bacterium]